MGHAEYAAALGLSPNALRIWRLEESGDGDPGFIRVRKPKTVGSVRVSDRLRSRFGFASIVAIESNAPKPVSFGLHVSLRAVLAQDGGIADRAHHRSLLAEGGMNRGKKGAQNIVQSGALLGDDHH